MSSYPSFNSSLYLKDFGNLSNLSLQVEKQVIKSEIESKIANVLFSKNQRHEKKWKLYEEIFKKYENKEILKTELTKITIRYRDIGEIIDEIEEAYPQLKEK